MVVGGPLSSDPDADTTGPHDEPASVSGLSCRVCWYSQEADDGFFTWFAVGNGIDPAMIGRLQQGGGMCPPHTRRILRQADAATRLTNVYRHVLPALRRRLTAWTVTPGMCPGCQRDQQASGTALATLAQAVRLSTSEYNATGELCMPHLRQAGDATPQALLTLTRTLASQLAADPLDLLTTLAGVDPDTAIRARLRTLLPAAGMLDETSAEPADTLTRMQVRLQTGCCPLCLAQRQHERRYLNWLVDEVRRGPHALANEPGGLCPVHLHDLMAIDVAAGMWALRRERHRWVKRLRDALVGSRRTVHAKVRRALHEDVCLVCQAVMAATASETALLLAALTGAPLQAVYPHTAGMCLRHVWSLPADGPITALVRQVALARLDLLAAELNDAARKTSWLARYEGRGPESTGWVRAAALIDGQVFLGGPPRTRIEAATTGA